MQCNMRLALAHASVLHSPDFIPPLGTIAKFFRSEAINPKKGICANALVYRLKSTQPIVYSSYAQVCVRTLNDNSKTVKSLRQIVLSL